jgi:microcystin degradation protein MlrC
MVTQSDDDGEGLVLERVRARVGPELPIVVTLDLHAHMTQRMLDHSTAVLIYKTCELSTLARSLPPSLPRSIAPSSLYL